MVCSEHSDVPRLRIVNTYEEVSKFNRGRIVSYWKCGLSFHNIARWTDLHLSTAMRIRYQWVTNGHIDEHAESQRFPMTNARDETQIHRSARKYRIITSGNRQIVIMLSLRTILRWTIAAAWPVSSATITSVSLKLDTVMAQCRLFRRAPLLCAVIWWQCITFWRILGHHTSS